MGLVVLADTPSDLKDMASELLDDVRGQGGTETTIVVLTPKQLAAESRLYPDIDAALAEALPTFQIDALGGFIWLHERLVGAPLPGGAGLDEKSNFPWPAVVGGGVLLLAVLAVSLSFRRRVPPRSTASV